MKWLGYYGAALLALAMLPILSIVVASFTAGDHIVFPPEGMSLRWYAAFFSNRDFMDSFWLSLRVATMTAIITGAFSVLTVLGLVRYRSSIASFAEIMIMAPLAVPAVALGVGFLIFYSRIGLSGSVTALVLCHSVLTFPLVFRLIHSNFTGYNWSLESAAANLGASPMQVFLFVTLPLIAPGIFGGMILAFIFSFDDVVVSLLLSGPRATTLPVRIFTYLDQSPGPIVLAAGSLLIFFASVLMLLLAWTVNIGRAFGVADSPGK